MALAHRPLRFSQEGCTLSMADMDIFVSTVDDMSTLATEVPLRGSCSVNSGK